MLSARMRTVAGWADARILNVSSRGLLVHALQAPEKGSIIELHHRDRAIVAQVMWREGSRAGVRAEDRVPVDEILLLGQSATPQAISDRGFIERRKKPRTADDSRLKGRLFEFVGVVTIATALALGGFTMVETAFARPLAAVQASLAR